MNIFIRSLIDKTFGTLIRHGLSGFGVWLAAKGIGSLDAGTQTNLTELAIGSICMGIPFVWSVVRSHISSKQIADLTGIASSFGFFGLRRNDLPSKPPPSIKADPLSLMLFVAFVSSSTIGCAVISKFDENTYSSASELKPISLSLISKCDKPADNFRADIAYLHHRLDAALAYEQGKGKSNVISAKQWEILISTDHDLLGKLLQKWEAGTKFSPPYIEEKSHQISDAWDQIIRLEGAKTKN